MRRITGIIVVLMVASLTLSACGGVRVVEPEGRYVDSESGQAISDTSEFLERERDKNPEEYSMLYELSKTNPQLIDQYVETKSNDSEVDKTIFSTSDKDSISKNEFLKILSSKYNIETNPIDTINAYYSALKEREFSSAFELLSTNGRSYKKYGRSSVFEEMHYGLDSNIKMTNVLIETIELLENTDPVIVKADYRIQGFFIVEPEKAEPPEEMDEFQKRDDEMNPEEIMKGMPQNGEEWEYTNSGIVRMTLELQDGKWLIHEVP